MCLGIGLARAEGRALIRALATVPPGLLREFAVEWRAGLVAHGPSKIVRK
jgi:hypothetical protein